MSGSREESPDWLRSFRAPTHSVLTLSSASDSSHNGNGDDGKVNAEVTSKKHMEPCAPKSSILALSSDSESCHDCSILREEKSFQFQEKEKDEDADLISREGKTPVSKEKSPKKGLKSPKKETEIINNVKRKVDNGVGNDDHDVVKEDTAETRNMPNVSTSTVPLVLSEKVQRTKALVECEGESIDLSGDMGAVGRIIVPDTADGNHEMYLDLKGTMYKTTLVPSRTFCIVSFGQSEAKIEAIMNDFIQLKPQSNVFEAETMVEGTLDGFLFDSEDESEKLVKAMSHQNDCEEQTNEKTKVKAGAGRKRGMTAGGKPQPPKKLRKKTPVSKKAKAKK